MRLMAVIHTQGGIYHCYTPGYGRHIPLLHPGYGRMGGIYTTVIHGLGRLGGIYTTVIPGFGK